MAIVVPDRLVSQPIGHRALVEALDRWLPADARIWCNGSIGSGRPDLVVLSPLHGILGIDVYPAQSSPHGDGGTIDFMGKLGRSLELLRDRLPSTLALPIRGWLAVPLMTKEEAVSALPVGQGLDLLITRDDLGADTLANRWRPLENPIDAETVELTRRCLYPEIEFLTSREARNAVDGNLRAKRILLDTEQECVARNLASEPTLLTGPAGSGKSLVLCARARILATSNPDWKVQILCFNRSLVAYLQQLVGVDTANVDVSTFFSWAARHGVRLPSFEEGEAATERAVQRGLESGAAVSTCDAILIDEGQDFSPSWLALARSALRSDRSEILVARDRTQCIYRDHPELPFEVHETRLNNSYRSTPQIIDFSSEALSAVLATAEGHGVEDPVPRKINRHTSGNPVHMVWADRWDDQAAFVAGAIADLTSSGEFVLGDIAVLVSQRSGTVRRLLAALDAEGISHTYVNRDRQTLAHLDLSEPTVKVMTIHTAKGMEFPVVFLVGLEALKVDPKSEASDESRSNHCRLAYVGMTRAQDLLYITYTRPNPLIEHGLRLRECSDSSSYPEDFAFAN